MVMIGCQSVFNNSIIIEWCKNKYTYEDGSVTLIYPLAYKTTPSIQLTVDYSAQFSGTSVQPGVWCGNSKNTQCTVYGNSTVLGSGEKIYFRVILIGY